MEGKVARQDGLAYIALLRQSVSQSGLEVEASRKRTVSCMEVLKCIIRVPNGTAWWCMVLRTMEGGGDCAEDTSARVINVILAT